MRLFDTAPLTSPVPVVVWRVRESISEPLMTGAGRQDNCLAGSVRLTSVRVNLAKRLARVCRLSRYRITPKCGVGTHARARTHTHIHVWFRLYIFTDGIAHNRSRRVASGIAIWRATNEKECKTKRYRRQNTWQASTTTATDTLSWPQSMRIASKQDTTHLN
jgi:hypothetical protein